MDDLEDDANVDVETEDEIDFADFVQVDGAADNDQGTIFFSWEMSVFSLLQQNTLVP